MIENIISLGPIFLLFSFLIIIFSVIFLYIDYLRTFLYFLENSGRFGYEYPNGKIFYLPFPWRRIILLTDAGDVTAVLNAKTKLSWFNKNFNKLNGLECSINNFNTDEEMWEILHKNLSMILSKNWPRLEELFEKYKAILLGEYSYIFEKNMEDFLLHIWVEFMYGSDNVKEFKKIRKKYIHFLEKQFHSRYDHFSPFYFCRNKNKEKIRDIKRNLLGFLDGCENGVFPDLFHCLIERNYSSEMVIRIMEDNAQLGILVFDFVYQVVTEYFKNLIGEKKEKNIRDFDSEILEQSIFRRFFFPVRLREMNQNILVNNNKLLIKPGDLCLLDLKESKLYFSGGPRGCVGKATMYRIIHLFHGLFENVRIQFKDPDECIDEWEINRNYPITKKKTNVILTYRENYIKTIIPSYEKIWNTLTIHNFPYLTDYLVSYSQYLINQYGNLSSNINRKIDLIIAPEVRGIPLASSLAYSINKSLYLIRKEGKLPGPIKSITYKTSYAENTIEINDYEDYQGKNVVLIDDGIAGGDTTLACIKLLQNVGANVVLVIAIFNHKYKERCKEYEKYDDITYTIFDL